MKSPLARQQPSCARVSVSMMYGMMNCSNIKRLLEIIALKKPRADTSFLVVADDLLCLCIVLKSLPILRQIGDFVESHFSSDQRSAIKKGLIRRQRITKQESLNSLAAIDTEARARPIII